MFGNMKIGVRLALGFGLGLLVVHYRDVIAGWLSRALDVDVFPPELYHLMKIPGKPMADDVGLITLLSLLGGFYAPVEIMPEVLQKAAMIAPPYWLIRALSVIQRGDAPARFVLSLAIMLLFAMAFLVVGSRRRME